MAYRQRPISEDGDVVCDRCGDYIGNLYTDGNFYALIRRLYCDECKDVMKHSNWAEASRRYRKRINSENKHYKTTVEKLTEYCELLEQKIIELRRENQ